MPFMALNNMNITSFRILGIHFGYSLSNQGPIAILADGPTVPS